MTGSILMVNVNARERTRANNYRSSSQGTHTAAAATISSYGLRARFPTPLKTALISRMCAQRSHGGVSLSLSPSRVPLVTQCSLVIYIVLHAVLSAYVRAIIFPFAARSSILSRPTVCILIKCLNGKMFGSIYCSLSTINPKYFEDHQFDSRFSKPCIDKSY